MRRKLAVWASILSSIFDTSSSAAQTAKPVPLGLAPEVAYPTSAANQQSLGPVTGFAALPGGGFVVHDLNTREVRRYNKAGRQLWSSRDRSVRAYRDLVVRGALIATLIDEPRPRVRVLRAADGKRVADIPIRVTRGMSVHLLGGIGEHWLVLRIKHSEDNGGHLRPLDHVEYSLASIDERGRETLDYQHIDSTPVSRVRYGVGWDAMVRPAYYQNPVFAVTSMGRVVISLNGGDTIHLVTRSDTLAIKIPSTPISVTPAMRDSFASDWGDTFSPRNEAVVAAMRDMPLPTRRPVVKALFPTAVDGELWVVRADSDSRPLRLGDSVRLDVVTRRGEVRGSVTLSDRETVVGATRTEVYTARSDERTVVGRSEGRVPVFLSRITRHRVVEKR